MEQVHVALVIDLMPDEGESLADVALELTDVIKSVSMEYGLIRQSEVSYLNRGDEGFVDSDEALAPQVREAREPVTVAVTDREAEPQVA